MSNVLLSQAELSESAAALLAAAENAGNEEQLKIAAEGILKDLCAREGIFWNPYSYEQGFQAGAGRVDALHGSTIIEFEATKCFSKKENARLLHARRQAEAYAGLLSAEECRKVDAYTLVVWDGESIAFGRFEDEAALWEPLRAFDAGSLRRLLNAIADGGRPLVSPQLLKQLVGTETEIGRLLLPKLFEVVCDAARRPHTNRTNLIFSEWSRLFDQVDGSPAERLSDYLAAVGRMHQIDYAKAPKAYFFALNTYIAVVAKVCAVYALASRSPEVLHPSPDPILFLKSIEEGEYFRQFGIENMLGTDFFSWYLGDDASASLSDALGVLLERLRTVDFNIAKKDPQSLRDLFKALYMGFTPSSVRHALGEYYTPDWLASHVMDRAGWTPEQALLDPTCGSGTFVLEGLRRRLEKALPETSAAELLDGLYGFDLNPLAVLAAKASIVVFLADRFSRTRPVLLPVFLADAINTADPEDGIYRHAILTEKGERTFAIPAALARSENFFAVMDQLRVLIDAGLESGTVWQSLTSVYPDAAKLDCAAHAAFIETIESLVELHKAHWNGIWCMILFDRIAAGCIRDVDRVAGNPPWVKWSHLPRSYAEFIKPLCDQMRIFSEDSWVGGIQSDISTVVTYRALARYVRKGGALAFLITGTVFKNESSQGFRRWQLVTPEGVEPVCVDGVEDYAALRPFEGVANSPALLLIRRNGEATKYPVRYRRYRTAAKTQGGKTQDGRKLGRFDDLYAMPVPGTDAGPWLVGKKSELRVWKRLFNASEASPFRARKGITTDANGIYFVQAEATELPGEVSIENNPALGRRSDLTAVKTTVEADDVFPLLRGRDVKRFCALPPAGQCVVVPQRGMFGDETLPATRPRPFRYLARFRSILEKRSSYRRFQQGKPFWSTWSTGDYTFAPFEVVWKEMSGKGFAAALVSASGFPTGAKTVVPDHKVYFVPLDDEAEAAYLTAFLNSRTVSDAISAYASALSLGTSVTDYLNIPAFDASNPIMQKMAEMTLRFCGGQTPSQEEEDELDRLVAEILE